MSQDNNNTGGPSTETTTHSQVIDMAQFRKDRAAPGGFPQAKHPAAITNEQSPVEVAVQAPQERTILISTVDGDVVLRGFLGLSQTFIAVGDAAGQIKFAAAPNKWMYASDVTGNPEYDKSIA